MLLCVDIGNSKVALGIFNDEELVAHWRIASDARRTSEEYTVILEGLFRLNEGIRHDELHGAIIASVVPPLVPILAKSIQEVCPNIVCKVLTHSMKLGMKNLYERPEEVGTDRLANAVAGKNMYGAPLVIADYGTATTIDIINREGDYMGGVILPGVEMTAEVLTQRTAQLPRIPIELPEKVIGTTTVKSMQSGICLGIVAGVDALIERAWSELGYESKVIATGGQAALLAAASHHVDGVEPYLTLFGLRDIWTMNLEE
jgi:type III pantothenate kinase